MSESRRRYAVIVHDNAKAMLYAHVRFVANVSDSAARKLLKTLLSSINSLKTMPYRCPIYHADNSGKLRRLVVERYQIIFTIDETASNVEINYIWDSRQIDEL